MLERNAPKAHLRHKSETGWPDRPSVVEGADAVLEFPAVRASVRLDDLYRPTALAPG